MIAIIKYGAGNVASVKNTLDRLGYESVITDNAEEIRKADKVILPGVGEASSAMAYLKNKGLDDVIRGLKQPILGICLGMQLMCKHSQEGDVDCLGIFDNRVRKFEKKDLVPHMGWNNLIDTRGILMNDISNTDDVYFVHSYYADISDSTSSVCNYITEFSSSLEKGNFYGTQFHPEKSADIGSKILNNFLKI